MIGVFDSGLGGLSVLKEIVPLIPNEEFIYIADSGYCPYGAKSREEIINRSKIITDYLISRGANMIVVACNTATAAAISFLRENYNIPFVGMEPAVKPAVLNTKTGVIGVLATQATFKGDLYKNTLNKFASDTIVIEQVGEGLVEIVEQDTINTPYAKNLLSKYISPMIENDADKLVLGCTHYPFLTNIINDITNGKIEIINPAPSVAKHAKEIWDTLNMNSNKDGLIKCEFFTTKDNLDVLMKLALPIFCNYESKNLTFDNISLL